MVAAHIPVELRPNILVVGSLAAAHHFRDELADHSVNTKDADVVVQPAGSLPESVAIAERLLASGWRKHEKCFAINEPSDAVRAVRLYPPDSDTYIVELLGLPDADQTETRRWVPMQLGDGWYGLPCFRFMRVLAVGQHQSEQGLRYAAPAQMALSNLLHHPAVGEETMSGAIGDRIIRRSVKDLARVVGLAWLGPNHVDDWATLCAVAQRSHPPSGVKL